MTDGEGRLLHSWRDGRARHPASVDDYANLCRAALALHEATGEDEYLAQARRMGRGARPPLLGRGGRRLFLFRRRHRGADRARQDRRRFARDPAGNGTLVGVLARLAILTGEDAYRRRAEAIVETFSGEARAQFFPARDLAQQCRIAGRTGADRHRRRDRTIRLSALRRAVYSVSLPNRVVLVPSPPVAGRHCPGLEPPRCLWARRLLVHWENPPPTSATGRCAICRSQLASGYSGRVRSKRLLTTR